MRYCGDDRGAFQVPGIVKLAIALAILGVLGYDGFVCVATHLKASDDAQNAAYAGSQAWENAAATQQQSAEVAFQAALQYLAGQQPQRCQAELANEATGAAPTTIPNGCDYICTGASNQAQVCGTHGQFSVDPDSTVHLIVRREASTLVFGHIGFMHSLLVGYGTGDADEEED